MKQAIISAGMTDVDMAKCYVSVLRRISDKEEQYVAWDVSIQDLFDSKQPDLRLRAHDQIMVAARRHPATQPTQLPPIK